jgi:hypothetical protein
MHRMLLLLQYYHGCPWYRSDPCDYVVMVNLSQEFLAFLLILLLFILLLLLLLRVLLLSFFFEEKVFTGQGHAETNLD